MLIKIMSGEDCPDDHPCKSFTLIENVNWYHTERDGNDVLIMEWTIKDEGEVQSVAPDGNVYIMNDAGKTIAHVGVSPPHAYYKPSETDEDDQPRPPRAKKPVDEVDAPNLFKVPKSVWRKWTGNARHAFNCVYAELGEVGQAHICHPETLKKGMPDEEWETIRWNAAWLAAHRMAGFEKQKVKAKEDYLFVGYAD